MRPRKRVAAVVFALHIPLCVSAQADSAARGQVGGTVYDSVSRRPIAGAVVELVPANRPGDALHSATTDSRGRYVISELVPGRYIAGFRHAALDTIGLESPLRLVDVRARETSRLHLAVPGPATIVEAICGRSGLADSTGLLVGVMRDVRTRMPPERGTVRASWQVLIVDAQGLRMFERDTTTAVAGDGWFRLCGIPAGVDVAIVSWTGDDSTGVIAASVPVAGLARRDLLIGGTALVRGVVRSERNRPIANARVDVIGRERAAATDSAGAFILAGIPAGTQTLEVRALGFAREHVPVVLAANADTTVDFKLTTLRRVLDTIRVVGRRAYSRDTEGFERRKRAGIGHFLDAETIAQRNPLDLIHLLRQIPSIRVVYDPESMSRRIMMRGGFGDGLCAPLVFLDGMRMATDMVGDWDLLVRPMEIAGLEVYRSVEAPPQFSGFTGCGSIVVWSRPTPRPPR